MKTMSAQSLVASAAANLGQKASGSKKCLATAAGYKSFRGRKSKGGRKPLMADQEIIDALKD